MKFHIPFLARPVFNLMMSAVVSRRKPDFTIYDSRAGEDGELPKIPYMLRWYVIPRNRWFNIYLHKFLRSDKDVPHDHPWWSVSLTLTEYLIERRWLPEPNTSRGGTQEVSVIHKGDVVFRSATYAHQIIVPESCAGSGVWTLFITGPKLRSWGFWCPKGWKHWEAFVAADNTGLPGAGCGDV